MTVVLNHFKSGKLFLFFFLLIGPVHADDYDLVLRNGRVMDPESNLDAIRNIGINKGKITLVTKSEISGRQLVDVSGLVIAPGFIDLHAHGQNNIANAYQARDGVTTALEMELGVFPIAKWYASRKGKSRLNYGATVNHLVARATVLRGQQEGVFNGMDSIIKVATPELIATELTPSKINQLLEQLEQGLSEGGLGIGIGIQYIPGARREEIYRVIQLAAGNNLPVFVHSRVVSTVEPDSISALQEMIADAAATGGSVHFVHIGSSGAQQVPVMLEMIDGARKHGIDITTEVYPYTAASTTIGAAVFSQGWRHRIGISFGDIQWLADGTRLTEKSFEYYRKEQPGGIVIAHFIPPAIIEQAVSHPGVMIVTDGGDWADNKGHPRGAGSFSRVLGTYVREKKTLTLMAAIRKMTLLPAQRLENFVPAMKFKGRIKSGADADITIFDPGTVQDKATYSEPMQYSEGIKHVLVGGEFVVMNEKVVEDAFPGKAIRR